MNFLHTDGLKTVRLYGRLGKRFGRVHKFQIENCAEGVKALCAMLPGFERELLQSQSRGVGYVCFYGKRNLGVEDLRRPAPENTEIRIAPVLVGAKRGGLGQIILGAIIVVAAVWTGGAAAGAAGAGGAAAGGAAAGGAAAGAAASASFLGVTGGYAIAAQLGVSMMLGGVIQALSPQQKMSSTRDGPDNGASYNFNGPVNTTAQGNVVPVGYGRMTIGSAVISAGIYTEDQS